MVQRQVCRSRSSRPKVGEARHLRRTGGRLSGLVPLRGTRPRPTVRITCESITRWILPLGYPGRRRSVSEKLVSASGSSVNLNTIPFRKITVKRRFLVSPGIASPPAPILSVRVPATRERLRGPHRDQRGGHPRGHDSPHTPTLPPLDSCSAIELIWDCAGGALRSFWWSTPRARPRGRRTSCGGPTPSGRRWSR